MGRKKKYQTKKEQLNAQRKWSLEYYYRNKTKLNKKRMKKYYDNLQSNE